MGLYNLATVHFLFLEARGRNRNLRVVDRNSTALCCISHDNKLVHVRYCWC